MKIILLKKINNLDIGTITTVKNGYAKNYLIPSQIALIANKKNIEKITKNTLNVNKINNDSLINELKKFNDTTIVIPVTIQHDDKMYGSINAQKLSKILKHLNIKLNVKDLNKNLLIKKAGQYKLEFQNKKHNIITTLYIILTKINDK